MGTAESPEQQERESELYVQEKYGGSHESVRPQSEDHAGSGSLGGVYATFEDTWEDVENEGCKGHIPFAGAYVAMAELAAAQQYQARPQDALKSFCESHDMALMDLKEYMSKIDDTREVLDVTCRGLEDVCERTIELRRKADDAHDRTRFHRERCRRATKDHEEVLNNSVGCLAALVNDTASATHAVSGGLPDRDSNETKYTQKALEMINDWQSRASRRSFEGHEGQETTEVIQVERPQQNHADR